MKLSVQARKWHKWVALVIGVQVLLWTASGLFMSFVPIDTVHSEDFIKKDEPLFFSDLKHYVSLENAAKNLNSDFGKIGEVKLRHVLDFPVFEFKNDLGRTALVNAESGELMSPLSENLIRKIVLSRYSGSQLIRSIGLIHDPVIEYRGKYPVWRVDFDNSDSTSFYIQPDDGELKAVRGTIWRIYDFLWMLHIMDYSERDNFNHWWLIVAAFLGFTVSISGFVLFFYSFRKRDFFFKKK